MDEYHSALIALLRSGQRFGRLDPRFDALRAPRLADADDSGRPSRLRLASWRLSAPASAAAPFAQAHSASDIVAADAGAPVVVNRTRDDCSPLEAQFFPPQSPFAATAILRFAEAQCAATPPRRCWSFTIRSTCAGSNTPAGMVPLAADLTAPLAEALQDTPRVYLAGFIQPGGGQDDARLNFLEPYQPGKIPVVLIHGLFSDPQSWADMINDLRACPGFAQHFQLWTFRYPTGRGFLRSAAELRQNLQTAFALCDPAGQDPALRRTVLIGHSMGGLIAKLQVTESEDKIWRQIANRPLDEIQTDEATRLLLAQACFFRPSPNVAKVIFIATPHCGSNSASGAVGRVASWLVETPPAEAAQHEQLIAQNPGVFAEFVQERLPTSVDMLEPQSPILQAMRELKFGRCVQLHNIIGVHSPIGPSDGVVLVDSAWHPGCKSEMTIPSPHGTCIANPRRRPKCCGFSASTGLR